MTYTVQALAALSGVSARTLRFYDSIDLLKPAYVAENGYRIYGTAEVDRLQQILFYRALGMKLEKIREILKAPEFDEQRALEQHLHTLLQRKAQIELQIQNVHKTMDAKKGAYKMKDKEKFEGFRAQMLEENEAKYGAEIRKKYGDDAVDATVFKVRGMSEEAWQEAEKLRKEAEGLFKTAMKEGSGPKGETAQRACACHGAWIRLFWKDGAYTKAAHQALGEMYVADERFSAYYDRHVAPGAARFISEALAAFAAQNP